MYLGTVANTAEPDTIALSVIVYVHLEWRRVASNRKDFSKGYFGYPCDVEVELLREVV
jgi:hypothetical protein